MPTIASKVPALKGINISTGVYREFAEIFGIKTTLSDSFKNYFDLSTLLNLGSNGRVIDSTRPYTQKDIIKILEGYGLKSGTSKKIFEFIKGDDLTYLALAPNVLLKVEASEKEGIMYYRFMKRTSGSPGSFAS